MASVISVGDIFQTKTSGVCEVLEVNGWNNIVVKFSTGFTTKTAKQTLTKGFVKDPYYPSVCGIGFIGQGKYSSKDSSGKTSLEYNTWIGMLHRCYDAHRQQKDKSYVDCSVVKEWHNFQNFAEWCQDQKGFGEKGWQIDKDILKKGNTQYSPEYCRFVPKALNCAVIFCERSRGELPIGVTKVDGEYKFRCIMSVNGKTKILGRFYTVEETFNFYKINKEQQIRNKAKEYEGIIPDEVFQALMNWEISYND